MSCKQNSLFTGFLFVFQQLWSLNLQCQIIHIVKAKSFFFSKFAIDLNVFLFISKLVTTVLFNVGNMIFDMIGIKIKLDFLVVLSILSMAELHTFIFTTEAKTRY